MKLPPKVLATRTRFVACFPLPQISEGTETDQAWTARLTAWTVKLAEQIAHDHPGDGYALKRGDRGRPVCKDCLAQRTDAYFVAWDQLIAAGSGKPTLKPDPDSLDMINPPDGPQFFEQEFVDYPRKNVPFRPWDHVAGFVAHPPPGTVLNPPVGPLPTVRKSLDDYFGFATALRGLYTAELGRDILLDPDAQANWMYHWREDARDLAWIQANIRTSAEWALRHGARGLLAPLSADDLDVAALACGRASLLDHADRLVPIAAKLSAEADRRRAEPVA